jgi:hypothetical protein
MSFTMWWLTLAAAAVRFDKLVRAIERALTPRWSENDQTNLPRAAPHCSRRDMQVANV